MMEDDRKTERQNNRETEQKKDRQIKRQTDKKQAVRKTELFQVKCPHKFDLS